MMASNVAILFLMTCIGITSSYDFRPIVEVLNPQFQPLSLLDVVDQGSVVRYNDDLTKFTVIKDRNLHACFLTRYDAEWNLDEEEKQNIVHTQRPRIVKTPPQLMQFGQTCGETIKSMCKKSLIFWIDSNEPQSPRGSPRDNTRMNSISGPFRFLPLKDDQNPSEHRIRTPPPIGGRSEFKAPPPLPGNIGHFRSPIRTPPPLPQAYHGPVSQVVKAPEEVEIQEKETPPPRIQEGKRRPVPYAAPQRLPSVVRPMLVKILPEQSVRSQAYPVPVKNEHVLTPFKINK